MIPSSLRSIKAHNDTWIVSQDFLRLGKPVHVRAVGFSRADALRQFEIEKFQVDQPDPQPFKALLDTIWALAGIIDSLIRFLGAIKALIISKLYNN